jgi:uncharacterized membrane protein YidH (DUF202 family)
LFLPVFLVPFHHPRTTPSARIPKAAYPHTSLLYSYATSCSCTTTDPIQNIITNFSPALERTYLSYHRTSLVLSLLSVIIAQLQVLQKSPAADTRFGFHVLGKPLAVTLVLCSMLISLIGAIRWWHWQQTLLRGKAICGGWELSVVGLLGFTLLVTFFGLVLAVGIKKTIEDVPELKN